MDAIIQHKKSGEHFLATLDDSGDVTHLSAALPLCDDHDRDWRERGVEIDWERYGYADVEPLGDLATPGDWTADRITVVHTF